MKKMMSVMMLLVVAAGVQANIVIDPGFESTPLGVVSDGSAPDTWVSWNGNFAVTTEMSRGGAQSVKVGVKDLVNVSAGDKFSDLRYEVEMSNPSELDNSSWVGGAWVYYDAANGSSTDVFSLVVRSRDFWNTARVESRYTVLGSELVSGAWNYIETTLDIPAQGLDPLDPNYDNKIRRRVTLNLEQNGWIGQAGVFYVDDVSLTLVPEPMTMALLGLGGLFLRRRRA